jgi:hypothetical protein
MIEGEGSMDSGELIIFVLYVFVSALLGGMGVPLLMGWVPPNPLYGFRTVRTQDPDVWYPVNRTTGVWLIVTGLVTFGIPSWTFFAGFGVPAAPLMNLVPVVIGLIAMIVHGTLIARRMATGRQNTRGD